MSYSIGFTVSEDACANGKGTMSGWSGSVVGGQLQQGRLTSGGYGRDNQQALGDLCFNKRVIGGGSNAVAVPLQSPGYEDWKVRQGADGSVMYSNVKDGVITQAKGSTW